MSITTIAFIVLFEVVALMLVTIVALIFHIRKLKAALRMRSDAKGNVSAEQVAQQSVTEEEFEEPPPMESLEDRDADTPAAAMKKARDPEYADYVDQHLLALRRDYYDLPGAVDIALDLDRSAPQDRNTMAIRHAFLIAEREAAASDTPDWSALQIRYKQLLGCLETANADKRIAELESKLAENSQQLEQMGRYRQRYLDMETRWHNSRDQAARHRDEIIAKIGGDSESELVSMVNEYHNSYDAFNDQFHSHEPLKIKLDVAQNEIKSLRATASKQRDMIDSLRAQLRNADNENAKTQLIRELESELQRQTRFISECESCVKLMEDELSAAHQAIKTLEQRSRELPALRMQVRDLTQDAEAQDETIARLKTDLALLKSSRRDDISIRSNEGSMIAADGNGDDASMPTAVDEQVVQLQKKLAVLQAQYSDLEERYLDMKLEQG